LFSDKQKNIHLKRKDENQIGRFMTNSLKFFDPNPENAPVETAIFMSGSGTNAEKILELWQLDKKQCSFRPVCLVTDRPDKSRTLELAKRFNIPAVAVDIFQFYQDNGASSISLKTEKGRQLRQQWTDKLRQALKPFPIKFAVFAGFVPLTNITNDFPCLNVHPGDLTCLQDEQRFLTGLHTLPVQKAILAGMESLRSTVILASTYSAAGAGMDEGLILGISEEVRIDWLGRSQEEYQQCYNLECCQSLPDTRVFLQD